MGFEIEKVTGTSWMNVTLLIVPFPRLQIKVDNIALRLVEDRPPPNITSPGTPPIDLAVPTLLILRDKSGLFSIRAPGSNTEPKHGLDLIDLRHPLEGSIVG